MQRKLISSEKKKDYLEVYSSLCEKFVIHIEVTVTELDNERTPPNKRDQEIEDTLQMIRTLARKLGIPPFGFAPYQEEIVDVLTIRKACGERIVEVPPPKGQTKFFKHYERSKISQIKRLAREALAQHLRLLPEEGGTIPSIYHWTLDKEKREVKYNGKGPVKLEPRLFELFEHLHKNRKTTIKALRRNLKGKAAYELWVEDRLNKLVSALDREHKTLGLKKEEIKKIIEKEKDGKKLKSVAFHAR